MTDVDYTVSTAVSISKPLLTVTASCPYVTATLTGSESDWAELLTDCTSCADLDGYKITVVQSIYFEAFTFTTTSIDHLGGCLATATTASAICITQSVYGSPIIGTAACLDSAGAADTTCTSNNSGPS